MPIFVFPLLIIVDVPCHYESRRNQKRFLDSCLRRNDENLILNLKYILLALVKYFSSFLILHFLGRAEDLPEFV